MLNMWVLVTLFFSSLTDFTKHLFFKLHEKELCCCHITACECYHVIRLVSNNSYLTVSATWFCNLPQRSHLMWQHVCSYETAPQSCAGLLHVMMLRRFFKWWLRPFSTSCISQCVILQIFCLSVCRRPKWVLQPTPVLLMGDDNCLIAVGSTPCTMLEKKLKEGLVYLATTMRSAWSTRNVLPPCSLSCKRRFCPIHGGDSTSLYRKAMANWRGLIDWLADSLTDWLISKLNKTFFYIPLLYKDPGRNWCTLNKNSCIFGETFCLVNRSKLAAIRLLAIAK